MEYITKCNISAFIIYINMLLVAIPDVDTTFHKQAKQPQATAKRHKRKNREIRVFVSSTFKEFAQEREQLIKKTFREVYNQMMFVFLKITERLDSAEKGNLCMVKVTRQVDIILISH